MSAAVGLSLAAAAAGICYAVWCARWILKQSEGAPALQIPYVAIRDAAQAFLRTQYTTIFKVGLAFVVVLAIVPRLGLLTAVGFAVGGACSALAGAAGMWVSVRANVRTAAAAERGLPHALRVAVRSGSFTGFLVGALALAAVSGFYLLLGALSAPDAPDLRPLAGLGFGASLVSIFARLGGGIFTKAADVGADLVGKIEQGIPEDDPRNPAVIADNVGDNVGDCAGMAADLFESYAVTLVATILVAEWLLPAHLVAQHYPLALGAVGLVAGVVGMQAIRLGDDSHILYALLRGVVVSTLLAAAGFYGVSHWFMTGMGAFTPDKLFAVTLVGLVIALTLVGSTIYFTSSGFAPVRSIAHASRSGHATNIITGLAVGMKSTVLPVVIVAAGIMVVYGLAGVYGIAVATCAMLSLTPVIVTIDAYGPVTDNAGGIAEMAHLEEGVRKVTDTLDAAGNTTKAVTKAFAIGSAGLAALALFGAFTIDFGVHGHVFDFSIGNPYTLAGLFLGALLPFLFSGYILDAVGVAAGRVVMEVREQFKAHPDIMAGTRLPDYARTVSLLTRESLRGMLIPGLIPVVAPLLIALIWVPFGPRGSAVQLMGGLLIGVIISGYLMAVSMSTGGAAWDNAKKYIEAGHEGGKGSAAHHAAITGDTVGDPYKDTAGPAINPMIKVINLIALLLVPFLA
jgi:K(+)-stimulated pyrophosphate-energized sodium pump